METFKLLKNTMLHLYIYITDGFMTIITYTVFVLLSDNY